MKNHPAFLPLLVIGSALVALVFACSIGGDGDDSRGALDDDTSPGDDDDSLSPGDDDATDDDAADDDAADDDDDASPNLYAGTVVEATTGAPMQGVAVELLNDATAASLDPPLTTTTDSLGQFTLDAPGDLAVAGVKLTIADYPDTYFYHTRSNSAVGGSATFGMYSSFTWSQLLSIVGLTPNANKGQVLGGVIWTDGSDSPAAVGCATAQFTPSSGQLFYADDNAWPTAARNSTNPGNGLFFLANINQSAATVAASVAGNDLSFDLPKVFPGGLHMVYLTYGPPDCPANPTPAGCE